MAASLCHSLVPHTIIHLIRFAKSSNCNKLFESKNRITNAEATARRMLCIVQMMHIAVTRNRAVIPARLGHSGGDFRPPFFVTFLDKQKSK